MENLSSTNLEAIVKHAAAGIATLDLDGNYLSVNQTFCEILGYSEKELKSTNFRHVTPSNDLNQINQQFQVLAEGGSEKIVTEKRYHTKSGKIKWVMLSATAIKSSDDQVQYIVSVIQDISEKKKLEEESKLAHVAFSHSGDGILVTDQSHTIIRTNPAFETFSGYNASELIGRKPFLLRSGEHDESFYNHIWKALEIDGRWQGEISYRHKNGTLFYVWETISEVYDEREEVSHYVSTFADMTEMKAKQKALDDIASLDALTGLPNRYSFNINLAQAVNQAEEKRSNLALLFIDLNKFKPVNDQYGHNAGDQALKQLAERLKKAVRKQDTVARVGGDEFVVLMTHIYSRRDIESTAARIVNELSKPMSIFDFNNISVGASIGISIYPDDLQVEDEELNTKDSQTQLVEKADLAMYRAKQSQHDYCFYDQAMR